MNKSLRIGFLLGSPDISGGTYVIFEHGSGLVQKGHRVAMITEQPVERTRYNWHPKAQDLDWQILDEAAKSTFDIIIATWWQSVFLLSKLDAHHYVYFVQSIESRFFEDEDPTHHDRQILGLLKQYCESTYSINLPVITEAEWIVQYLSDNYSRQTYLVRNGIRKDIYREEGSSVKPRIEGRLRVLVEGPVDVFYKNVPKSIELCRQAGVEEVWLMTSSNLDRFEGVDRVFSQVPIHETPAIYRSCDVLVKLSHIEGMFGPPLEMFHCGGTAIVYDVTGHDEYIVHDTNGYVVPKDEDEKVVQYLQTLRQESTELKRLVSGARDTASEWPDWPKTSLAFEETLKEISVQPRINRSFLAKWLTDRIEENKERFRAREVERFRARERTQDSNGLNSHNFVQVYCWAENDDFDPNSVSWDYYKSGEKVSITIPVIVTGHPFWIRVDPSTRIGLISIDSITIRYGDKVLYNCVTPEDFNKLYLDGTIRRVGGQAKAVFLSYGDDPQLVLPAVTEGAIGDELQVVICLEETGIAQFVNRYCGNEKDRIGKGRSKFINRLVRKLRSV